MKHSLLRQKGEDIRLFVHTDPEEQHQLEIYKLKIRDISNINNLNNLNNIILENITPNNFIIEDLGEYRFACNITAPLEDCYLLITFFNQPIVLRIGSPYLQFIYWDSEGQEINFIQRDENGNEVDSGSLIPLVNNFYFYTPSYKELSYFNIDNYSHILDIPYCSKAVNVAFDIVWNKKIVTKKFGKKIIIQSFNNSILINKFFKNIIKNKFNNKYKTKSFNSKTIAKRFKISCPK